MENVAQDGREAENMKQACHTAKSAHCTWSETTTSLHRLDLEQAQTGC